MEKEVPFLEFSIGVCRASEREYRMGKYIGRAGGYRL